MHTEGRQVFNLPDHTRLWWGDDYLCNLIRFVTQQDNCLPLGEVASLSRLMASLQKCATKNASLRYSLRFVNAVFKKLLTD